ncbi:glycosyltransferase family 2 protein [Rhodobacteraceae bacterium D3-12]|nr:glycosyltransferase family 2 protein [Rhodobacteraceae bacterium D3-12]
MIASASLAEQARWLLGTGLFDEAWYTTTYGDVLHAQMSPSEHYIRIGLLLDRKPGPDTTAEQVRAARARPLTLPSDGEDATALWTRSRNSYQGPDRPAPGQKLPRVSVIMTAYNAEDTITAAIASLQAQSYRDVEIVICDDVSTDGTWAKLQEVQTQDPDRIIITRNPENLGTYAAKNRALSLATGDVVLFQDSDDRSHPDRVMIQVLPLLEQPALIATRSAYARYNPETGKTIALGGKVSRIGLITLAVRRRIFDEIGYFEPVRRAGDDEWFQRLTHFSGAESILNINTVLYLAELRTDSLATDMLLTRPDGTLDQIPSPARRAYVDTFRARFADPAKDATWFRTRFPGVG